MLFFFSTKSIIFHPGTYLFALNAFFGYNFPFYYNFFEFLYNIAEA